MNIHVASRKLCLLAAGILIVLPASVELLAGEVHPSNNGSVQPQKPFHIISACPPAVCSANWDGQSDPANGATDFRPAGIPEQFSFSTGNPVDWYCDPQTEECHADYNSGTFTATGPAGTFTGTITSGYAHEAPLGWEISVNFTGQWANGQRMTGYANERYVEEFQIPDTTLIMTPTH